MRYNEVSGYKFFPYYNKKISISNKEDKPLRFQIPRMYMPFGISGFVPKSGPTKWNIDFSMKDVQGFLDFVRIFESSVIEEVSKQSVDIFGHQKSVEELVPMFNSSIKEDSSGNWESKFRVKIDENADIFNQNEIKFEEEFTNNMFSRHTGLAIVEVTSVYFINKQFGVTWKVYQLKTYEPQMLKGFAFRDV